MVAGAYGSQGHVGSIRDRHLKNSQTLYLNRHQQDTNGVLIIGKTQGRNDNTEPGSRVHVGSINPYHTASKNFLRKLGRLDDVTLSKNTDSQLGSVANRNCSSLSTIPRPPMNASPGLNIGNLAEPRAATRTFSANSRSDYQNPVSGVAHKPKAFPISSTGWDALRPRTRPPEIQGVGLKRAHDEISPTEINMKVPAHQNGDRVLPSRNCLDLTNSRDRLQPRVVIKRQPSTSSLSFSTSSSHSDSSASESEDDDSSSSVVEVPPSRHRTSDHPARQSSKSESMKRFEPAEVVSHSQATVPKLKPSLQSQPGPSILQLHHIPQSSVLSDSGPFYPAFCYRDSPTFNTWAKLSIKAIYDLTDRPGFGVQGIYFFNNHPIRYVQLTCPVVQVLDQTRGLLILTIDDGSGAVMDVRVRNPARAVKGDAMYLAYRDRFPDKLVSITSLRIEGTTRLPERHPLLYPPGMDLPSPSSKEKKVSTKKEKDTTPEKTETKTQPLPSFHHPQNELSNLLIVLHPPPITSLSPTTIDHLAVDSILIDGHALIPGSILKLKCTISTFRSIRQLDLRRVTGFDSGGGAGVMAEVRSWTDGAAWRRDVLAHEWVVSEKRVGVLRARAMRKRGMGG